MSHRGDAVFFAADGGARWRCAGALTFANAAHAVAASAALALPHAGVVACDELGHVDSAAVAVLLAVKRRALKEGKALRFEGVPPPLQSLATVYGVDRVLAD